MSRIRVPHLERVVSRAWYAVPVALVLLAGVAHGDATPKVTICHLPPGNPSNVQLITVGAPAVPAHLANHGDAVCAAGNNDCCADRSGEVCTNLQDDANNCGRCGIVCPAGDICSAGVCGCSIAGDTNCNGTCTDTSTDPSNCGQCGTVCSEGQVCNSGVCVTTFACPVLDGLGCYWLDCEQYDGHCCWDLNGFFADTAAGCQELDSCNPGGGGGSGGGCYKWANSSDTAIFPPWP